MINAYATVLPQRQGAPRVTVLTADEAYQVYLRFNRLDEERLVQAFAEEPECIEYSGKAPPDRR